MWAWCAYCWQQQVRPCPSGQKVGSRGIIVITLNYPGKEAASGSGGEKLAVGPSTVGKEKITSFWALVLLRRSSEGSRSAEGFFYTVERNWTPPYATRSGAKQPCSKGGSRLIVAVPWLIRIACRLQKTHHTQICPEVIISKIPWWFHQVISDSISFSLLCHPQHSLLASRPPHIPRWLPSILPSHTHFRHQERQKGSTSQLYQLHQGAFPEVHFCCISWNLVLWLYLAAREDGKDIFLVWFITISNEIIFLQRRKSREQILDGVSLQQLSRNVANSKLHEDV